MSFYLKYSNDNWSTESSLEIDNYILNDLINNADKITGRTLRGYGYQHVNFKFKKRIISLSADFLINSSNKEFIQNFVIANSCRYSDDDVTYHDVIVPKGDYVFEYLSENRKLPELDFEIEYKEPD